MLTFCLRTLWLTVATCLSLLWSSAQAETGGGAGTGTSIVIGGTGYVRASGDGEVLVASFGGVSQPTAPQANARSTRVYSGYVEVLVSGSGKASGTALNDAFYVYTDLSGNPIPPFNPGIWYQLAIDTATIQGQPGAATEIGQHAKQLVVRDLRAGVPLSPGQAPAYRTDHVYRFVIDVSLAQSWGGEPDHLNFTVANGQYDDNSGSYNIELHQLVEEQAPAGEAALLQAAPTAGGGTRVTVQVTGGTAGAPIPDIEVLTAAACEDGALVAPERLALLADVASEITGTSTFDINGNAFVVEPLAASGAQYASARLVSGSAAGPASPCIVVGPDNDSWTRAQEIALGSEAVTVGGEAGFIDAPGRARWYKFAIQPNASATVELSNLPADYDLVLFKDIAQAFEALTAGNDADTDALDRLGAEFASTYLNTTEISPFAFSPAEISPFAFSPFAFSPFAFSSSLYAGDAVAPFAFSPFAYSPTAGGASAYSPFAFSPFAFSPFAFSPFAFSAENYSSAQTRSVIGVSAQTGTTTERVSALTWNNTGDFYIRVAAKNGDADIQQPFQVTVTYEGGLCAGVTPPTEQELSELDGRAEAGFYDSIIFYDSSRLATDGYSLPEQAPLRAKLDALAARPDVNGLVVDLGTYLTIQSLHVQADENDACPYAENLVAGAIKRVIDAHRRLNPDLAFVVLAGSDGQIPFFRYPDQTLLGPESQYEPPVRDFTQSQSALRLNYVLGQDEYGAGTTLSLRDGELPVPQLAVGRLVETPSEIINMIDAYLEAPGGVISTPTSTLVVGYDFLDDAAEAIQLELEAGTRGVAGARNETLIASGDLSPEDPGSWTATQLRQRLLDQPEQMVFLAGHFNAFSALAADFRTTFSTTELLASPANFRNALIYSAGCHSGYNAVNQEQVDGLPPDWAQAFARKGATFIGGTGYQYGDTEFIEFGERLYLEFTRVLRTGSGPVAIGQALVKAKQRYLAEEPDIRGLHRKTLLISTLFGLPMARIDLGGERLDDPDSMSVVSNYGPVGLDPGQFLGLQSADLHLDFGADLVPREVPLVDITGGVVGGTVDATYLSGLDGLVINPGEPVLPRKSLNVSVPMQSLRGVGFRGGLWSETTDVIPLTGAPATELRSPQTRFASLENYPMRLAFPNYFRSLSGTGGTVLHVTPVQHRVEQIGENAVRRQFDTLDYRLYYSSNTVTYGANTPAFSAAPTLTNLAVTPDGNDVVLRATVVGDPAAGIQSVWVTYTDGALTSGEWLPLDLTQSPQDSRVWTGRLSNAMTQFGRLDVVFHAVNGVGLVATDDNYGRYFQVRGAPATLASTALAFDGPVPASVDYRSTVPVAVLLRTASGAAIGDATVVFSLGTSTRSARTDPGGRAAVDLPASSRPGSYRLTATFAGNGQYRPASVERPLVIGRAATRLVLTQGGQTVLVDGVDTGLSAQLTVDDAAGTPLTERTVFFTVQGGRDGTQTIPVITDQQGVARLGALPAHAGTYQVTARFLGVIPDLLQEITDPVYLASSASTSLNLSNGPGCPTAGIKGKIDVTGFCYLTSQVDGKVSITNGTLIVGGATEVTGGIYVDQKIDQYGDGSVVIGTGARVRGKITERGAGGIRVHGFVGGNLDESGAGDVVVSAGGSVDGNVFEADAGSVLIDGAVDGNVFETGEGDLRVGASGSVEGNVSESGPGQAFVSGTVTGNVTQD
ncbi:MAG: hypothetical protein RIE74_16950 [Pseudomonadales bacterium]